jgi:hypothetical protein
LNQLKEKGGKQNPQTKSRLAQMARSGKKVMQFLSEGPFGGQRRMRDADSAPILAAARIWVGWGVSEALEGFVTSAAGGSLVGDGWRLDKIPPA